MPQDDNPIIKRRILSQNIKWWLVSLGLAAIVFAILRLPSNHSTVFAQSTYEDWTTPIKISEAPGNIRDPIILVDQSDKVHIFWRFTDLSENQNGTGLDLIFYTQWNGLSWSQPFDLLALSDAKAPSATVDQNDILHLIWHGLNNTLYYRQAPADGAASISSWSKPEALAQSLLNAQIIAGRDGQLYVGYPGLDTSGPYYMSSEDGGVTWSFPVNISKTSRPDSMADVVRLAISDNGDIHVVWTEFQSPDHWPPLGVFYSHSNDGGRTWATPIEFAGYGYDEINIALGDNETVHVAWNGSALVSGRYHSWSSDGGKTWSEVITVIPPEQCGGSIGPPPLVVDSQGDLHLITTDGFCVWYTSWQNQRWKSPVCISGEENSAITHTEGPAMTLGMGNQLHVAFWLENRENINIPQSLWYTSLKTSAPKSTPRSTIPSLPSPTPQLNDHPTVSSSSIPELTVTSDLNGKEEGIVSSTPGKPMVLGILPAVIFLFGVLMIWGWSRRRY